MIEFKKQAEGILVKATLIELEAHKNRISSMISQKEEEKKEKKGKKEKKEKYEQDQRELSDKFNEIYEKIIGDKVMIEINYTYQCNKINILIIFFANIDNNFLIKIKNIKLKNIISLDLSKNIIHICASKVASKNEFCLHLSLLN